ncbi:CHAT domain-containing protein [bacterium]|nr:CHAT domain-containing protein [bacterium]
MRRLLTILLLSWRLVSAEPAFIEADSAFNQGDLARAEQLYQEFAQQALGDGNLESQARALEGLAAVFLSTGRDDRYRATMQEVVRVRRSLPGSTSQELLLEGGFERGLVPPWGTGHYESGNFNFGIWWNSSSCRSFAKMDSAVAHRGRSSLRLTNFSKAGAHIFGTTAQRIRAVQPNTVYEAELWARADSLASGSVLVVADAAWHVRLFSLPPGSYDWTPFRVQFNSKDLSFIDFRIIHQNTGTVWLDEVVLRPVVGAVSDPLLQAESLYQNGQIQAALDRYLQLEKEWADDPGRLRAVWLRLADAWTWAGEYGKAMELYAKVQTAGAYPVWMAMGDIYLNLGQPELALQQYQHVYLQAAGDQARRAQAADRMAMSLLRLGRLSDALAFENESLAVMVHINDPHGRAQGLCHLGQILTVAAQSQAARDRFESALPLAQASGDRKLESDILTHRAILIGQGGADAQVMRDLAQAIQLRRQVYDQYGLIFSLYWQGKFLAQRGDVSAASISLHEAVELLEGVKDGAGSIERGGETLLKSQAEVYEEYIRLLLQQGRHEEALEALARSRRQELRRLFEVQQASLPPLRQRALEQSRSIQGEREALERKLQKELSLPAGQQNSGQVEQTRQQREQRISDYRQFLRELFQSQPELAGMISVHPKQLRAKQSALGKDEAVVEYLCGQNQLYLFLVTPKALEVKVLDLPRAELQRRVLQMRQLLISPQADTKSLSIQSHQLYGDLIKPLEPWLRETQSLAILPNGPLHYLPFQALLRDPGKGQYVGDRWACINLCEESFLAPAPAGRAPQRMLLLGNPDGTLAAAEREVLRISQIFPGCPAYLGKAAKKSLVQQAGGSYQGLHIASHGLLDRNDVTRSYILLAPESSDASSGRLTMREIWGLDLKGMQLVTLSACLTGLGEGNPGDDLISLENAFVFAGANSVVASLWEVSDEASAMLMTEFYQNLKKLGPARALQRAQRTTRDKYPHPYFWAPFIFVGPTESKR